MVWSNNSQDSIGTPCGARTGIVRAPHGNLQSFTYPAGPVWDPQGCRTAALRTRKEIDTNRIGKKPARAWYLAVRGPYVPLTGPAGAVRGLFSISKPVRGPQAYNACIKTLLAPYGEAKFVRRRTGPVRAPWVDVRFLFKTARKQPGNSPETAREQPVRVPGMWCDWGISATLQ